MAATLWTFPIRRKRDVLLARQRARQLAALLGFDPHQQATIAAGTFAVAWQVFAGDAPPHLCFRLDPPKLHIYLDFAPGTKPASGSPLLRLEKPLPGGAARLEVMDWTWTCDQLNHWTTASLYEEVQRQNQEILGLLVSLQTCQAQLAQLKQEHSNPSAA